MKTSSRALSVEAKCIGYFFFQLFGGFSTHAMPKSRQMTGTSRHFASMTPARTTEEKKKYGKKEQGNKKRRNQDVEINSMKNNYAYSKTL